MRKPRQTSKPMGWPCCPGLGSAPKSGYKERAQTPGVRYQSAISGGNYIHQLRDREADPEKCHVCTWRELLYKTFKRVVYLHGFTVMAATQFCREFDKFVNESDENKVLARKVLCAGVTAVLKKHKATPFGIRSIVSGIRKELGKKGG